MKRIDFVVDVRVVPGQAPSSRSTSALHVHVSNGRPAGAKRSPAFGRSRTPTQRLRLLFSDGSTSFSRCCPLGMLTAWPAGPNSPVCFGAQRGVTHLKDHKPVRSLHRRTQGPVLGQRFNGQGTERDVAQGHQPQAERDAHRSAGRHRRTYRPAQGADRQPGRESVKGALQRQWKSS